jgi:hypothetical protein
MNARQAADIYIAARDWKNATTANAATAAERRLERGLLALLEDEPWPQPGRVLSAPRSALDQYRALTEA